MKIGDVVLFPCDFENYSMKTGLLMGVRDNPSDVRQIEMAKHHLSCVPVYCEDGPRQVADIFYNGKFTTCWKHNIKEIKNPNLEISV